MTIGEEITATITKTLDEARSRGEPIVPCSTLWHVVGKNRTLGDPYYGRYKSVLRELLQTARIKMHMDSEGRPAGFEVLRH